MGGANIDRCPGVCDSGCQGLLAQNCLDTTSSSLFHEPAVIHVLAVYDHAIEPLIEQTAIGIKICSFKVFRHLKAPFRVLVGNANQNGIRAGFHRMGVGCSLHVGE